MSHPLVEQLRFTRSEFMRALEGLSDEDARKRFPPLNCISWNVGHLAWQEQTRLLYFGTGRKLFLELDSIVGRGQPATTPPLNEMIHAWQTVTAATNLWLDNLSSEDMVKHVVKEGIASDEIWGTVLLRVIYHYWYHLGENAGIRQMLGHTDLPQFVGNIDSQAPYRVE
ncbi:MAG TPA: DinB family protein [Anaerolineaceae bacterium]|nr:DinB family protein [Anaerolineaceae bacterium]